VAGGGRALSGRVRGEDGDVLANEAAVKARFSTLTLKQKRLLLDSLIEGACRSRNPRPRQAVPVRSDRHQPQELRESADG
jgi:hypothetical protein